MGNNGNNHIEKNCPYKIKYNKLKLQNHALNEENQNYRQIISSTKVLLEANNTKNNRFNYDIAIGVEPFNQIINGWDIKFGNNNSKKIYLEMRNTDTLLIGILGLKNKGKSYII